MSLSNKPLEIAIRVDSSYNIGSGHVMRCLTLAGNLRANGSNIRFICQPLPGDLIDFILEKGYQVEQHLSLKVDWLIVDHYGLDKKWETQMRARAQRIMVIDDLANRQHDCDLLLDQTYQRVPDDYKQLVPNNCRLLLGTDYALIAPPFRELRAASLKRRKTNGTVKNIVISMGGADPDNIAARLGNVLHQIDFKRPIKIVLGKHMHQPMLAKMLAAADLAIGAGGTTSWERCCLGLPSVMISIADNQLHIANRLHKVGAVNYLGHHDTINIRKLSQAVQDLIQNPSQLKKMSDSAATVCDGLGAKRVALEIYSELANDGTPVRLRRADINDAKIMRAWQQDPSTRRYARNPKPPTLSEHTLWLKKRLSDPDCVFNIILFRDQPAGVLRFDKIDHSNNVYEISIVIAPEYRRLGLASAALKLGRKMLPQVELRAQVLPGNTSSHHLFRNEGYELLDGIYIHKIKERV